MKIEDKNSIKIEADDVKNRAVKLLAAVLKEINSTPEKERDVLFFSVINELIQSIALPAAHKHGIVFQAIVFDLTNSTIRTHKRLGYL